ncbi:heme-degrading monooxygenase HmoA [Motilibacter rhizosphaerae]|uniref:Heme-degrading monooxygenase HmoA n=1 Tax=Motilibacter rhizosphaerae TaxID=598652 RepID=A0A4Q7NRL5_9ACTN|nr:antibiotic biosynthesis monooxygenase [Motilibacter rhizosphaerae]RZS89716.1 heme-degrading monooxygenase HmoA [Motilibacter rhizosphaerae]
MLVVTRHRVPVESGESFAAAVAAAVELLAARPGFLGADAGPNLDEPDLWTLVVRWESVGAARRGMSAADARAALMAVLVSAVDEPTTYDVRVSR